MILTSSFNNAVSVALNTLGLSCGDEIIASPMACLASTQPYLSSGIKVKWADVDSKCGTLDPKSVETQITPKTKAIVHNHFCGYPGYIDEINDIGKRYNIPVIDDGIECFGSKYKSKLVGNCGTDVTVFSLTAVRIPNCIDGGIVIFSDESLYEKSLLVRDCGIERSKFRDKMGEISPECDINVIGYSAMMSNVNGYIGLKQMERVQSLIDAHRRQAQKWTEYFKKQSQYVPLYTENTDPNYWVYGILTDNKKECITEFRDRGYYASGVHINNNIYSVFGKQDIELPGTNEFYNRFVALPCGWWMSNNLNIGGNENE